MTDKSEREVQEDAVDAALLEKQRIRKEQRLALYSSLEKRLGIPDGFIDRLIRIEDDWGFIVQTAVLCEATVTHVLVAHACKDGRPDVWYDHFSRLPNHQRLSLANSLGLLDAKDQSALDAVATIRNAFAHDVANLGGSLSAFFSRCHPSKKVQIANACTGEKHTEADDWTFYTKNIRVLITVAALGPIRVVARKGMQATEREAFEKQWELADLFSRSENAARLPTRR